MGSRPIIRPNSRMDPILIDLPDELVGERTVVRPYRAGDGAALFEAIDESREHILPWMPWGPQHAKPSDTEAFVRQARARYDRREDLPLAFFDRHTRRILGGTGLHRIDWAVRSFEIGYWVRVSAQGKGYVTETALLLTKLCFEVLEANRVTITVAVENERSAAIPPRLGFKLEGTLRNSIRDAHGVLHDRLVFGMTPEEWRARG